MIPLLRLLPLLLPILTLQLTTCSASITNARVNRLTDVASSLAISKTTITMRNDDSKAEECFYVILSNKVAEHLGDFWIATTDDPHSSLRIQLSDELTGVDSRTVTTYKAFFSSPLAPADEITVEVRMDVSNTVKPVPETIEGYQSQYINYADNVYFYTPYHTESMETTLILGSQEIPFKEGLLEPFEVTSKRIKMGPYKNVEPFSIAPLSIRFKNDRALLVASNMIKQFYVSHWGTIATKEEYYLYNAAAAHQGEWSRADHTRYKSKYATAAGDIWANLPPHARRVAYTDLVGNITTSRLRKPTKTKRAIQLMFRFPLMGGWRTHLWITYDTLLNKYAVSKGTEHVLTLPIFPTANMDLLCEQLEVRVLLPEGAHTIEVDDHPSVTFDVTKTRERTTLVVLGRPVVTLKINAIRSQSKHIRTITLRYQYNTLLVWITPIFVATAILSLFISCILCVRNGLNISDEQTPQQSLKLKSS